MLRSGILRTRCIDMSASKLSIPAAQVGYSRMHWCGSCHMRPEETVATYKHVCAGNYASCEERVIP